MLLILNDGALRCPSLSSLFIGLENPLFRLGLNLSLSLLSPEPHFRAQLHCLTLTAHLLTPHHDAQETPLSNADFSWFADGSYLKGDNGKYCTGCVIPMPFDVTEAAPLPLATKAQQAKCYPLTQVCTLGKGKTANIYTDSRYAFWVAHDFVMLWKQRDFLTFSRNKIKNGQYAQELLESVFLPAALAIILISGHSKLDSPSESWRKSPCWHFCKEWCL